MTHRSRIAALLLCSTVGATVGMATYAAAQDAPSQSVEQAMQRAVTDKTVPGAIVLIDKKGQQVFAEATGTADGMKLATDSVFWVASMTKPIVATSVMMMVEAGRVSLDDPVSKYIPQFAKARMVRTLAPNSPPFAKFVVGGPPMPNPNAPKPIFTTAPAERALTVRDMITMTGGLQTIAVPPAVPRVAADDTVASYTAKLGDAPLDFQPGSRFGYSNATEFEVLVRIVEVASGQPYAAWMKAHIFTPLAMPDTGFGIRADLKDRTTPLGMMAGSPLALGRFTSGSAGIWTTATDYSHFAQMLLNGGIYHGHRLLKASTVAAMSSNQIGDLSLGGVGPGDYGGLPAHTNPGVKYGYGLMVVTDPAQAGVALPAGSYGWDGVGSRRFWVDPKDGMVLIMLMPGGDAPTAQRAIEKAAVEAFGGKS